MEQRRNNRNVRRGGMAALKAIFRRPLQPDLYQHSIWNLPSFKSDITIVQLGAFVGATRNDPLYRFLRHFQSDLDGRPPRIKAVLVEPVREFYEKLKQNYDGCRNIFFENAAISDKPGSASFYRLKPGFNLRQLHMPEWLYQIGSLNPERITTLWDSYEKDPALREFLEENLQVEEVPCLTFDQLLRKHGIEELDLLQVDVEGYELQIFQSIDFASCRINMLNYERVLLGEKEAACRALLTSQGYVLWDHGQDTLAWREGLEWTKGWGHKTIRTWLTFVRAAGLSRQPLRKP